MDPVAQRDVEHRRVEELWTPSSRAYNKSRQQQVWWERLCYHEAQVRRLSVTMETLIAGHRREVSRYEELLGISENGHHKKGAR